jgi:hypothetical protein
VVLLFWGVFMGSVSDAQVDELVQKIMSKIEQVRAVDLTGSAEVGKILHLTDVGGAQRLLQNIETAATRDERDVGKRAIIRAMLLSTWLQRLYFVIRAFIMGLLGSFVSFGFILYFGAIDFLLGVVVGVFSFVFSLVVSRLFDVQIVWATRKIVSFLSSHPKLREFVLNHF